MKALVFSDVHGNLPALQIMLKDAGKVDQYICLGDIVGYGPWTNECVDLVTSLDNAVLLQGNHEKSYIEGKYESDNVSKQFFDFCYPNFYRKDRIKGLLDRCELNDHVFIHTIENRNIYPDSEILFNRNYVIGHSHVQFKIEQRGHVLYNVGSVGQNREYINVINYALLEDDKMEFEFKAIKYDVGVLIEEMRKQNYPKDCIDYYQQKKRA